MVETEPIPLNLLSEPVRDHIVWLQSRFRLTTAGACLCAIANVSCAVGPSRRIRNPVDFSWIYPTFSVVLYGEPSSLVVAAANIGFDPIRDWIYQRMGNTGRRALQGVRLRIAELNRKLIHQNFLLAGIKQPTLPGVEACAATEKELEQRRTESHNERAQLLRELNRETFRLAPHLLADDAPFSRLLDPGALAHDGAVMHTSAGYFATLWKRASRAEKGELSCLLESSWRGMLQCVGQEHLRPLLSNLLITDPIEARSLLDDRELIQSGVISRLLFVNALNDGQKEDLLTPPPSASSEYWIFSLNALMRDRLDGGIVDHTLGEEAIDRYRSYFQESLAKADLVVLQDSRRLQCAPILCLKIALLLHAVSPARDQEKIERDVVDAAITLTEAVYGDKLVSSQQKDSPSSPVAAEERELDSLVAKLELRGPLRWRDLLRGRRIQKADPLAQLLTLGINSGRIIKVGDLYQVPPLEKQ